MNSLKQDVARIAIEALEGKIATREMLKCRATKLVIVKDSKFAEIIHQVGHYIDDVDIRAADPKYAENQRRLLQDAISSLENEQ